jgi:hypothetical protein
MSVTSSASYKYQVLGQTRPVFPQNSSRICNWTFFEVPNYVFVFELFGCTTRASAWYAPTNGFFKRLMVVKQQAWHDTIEDVVLVPRADPFWSRLVNLNVKTCRDPQSTVARPPEIQLAPPGSLYHKARITLAVIAIFSPVTGQEGFLPSTSTLVSSISIVVLLPYRRP